MKLPTFRPKSTIKNDPFATVIPVPEANTAEDYRPQPQVEPPPPPRVQPLQHSGNAAGRRKITVHLRPDLVERVKNAAYWNPRLTIASIAEAGILHALEQVEKENGGPYPPREQELRGGRPIR